MSNAISNLGAVPTLTIGGRVMTDLTNLIVLHGNTSTNQTGFRIATGSSGYTPSGVKKFVAVAVHYDVATVQAGTGIRLGSCDNDIAIDAATAATNPVYMAGSINYKELNGNTVGNYERACDLQIPNGKYGFATTNTATITASITIYGYEV